MPVSSNKNRFIQHLSREQGGLRLALRCAANIHANVDRRMPEGMALASWLLQSASSLGLDESALPDEDTMEKRKRRGVSVRDWYSIRDAIRAASVMLPAKGRTPADLWLNDGSCIRLRAEYPGHVWSYDFMEGRIHDGRKFRILSVIDEASRECLALPGSRPKRERRNRPPSPPAIASGAKRTSLSFSAPPSRKLQARRQEPFWPRSRDGRHAMSSSSCPPATCRSTRSSSSHRSFVPASRNPAAT